jgi:hypothetical protein
VSEIVDKALRELGWRSGHEGVYPYWEHPRMPTVRWSYESATGEALSDAVRQLAQARAELEAVTAERDELLATMLRIEQLLTESTENLDKFLLGIGAAPEAPHSTASGRPVERFTHDVKGNKL